MTSNAGVTIFYLHCSIFINFSLKLCSPDHFFFLFLNAVKYNGVNKYTLYKELPAFPMIVSCVLDMWTYTRIPCVFGLRCLQVSSFFPSLVFLLVRCDGCLSPLPYVTVYCLNKEQRFTKGSIFFECLFFVL